jgi:hypothetical protein
MPSTLSTVGFLVLDALLSVCGSALALVFLRLMVMSAPLETRRLLVASVLGCALSAAIAADGCGCRDLDRALDAGLRALRVRPEEPEAGHARVEAYAAPSPHATPWPPPSPAKHGPW